MCSYSALVTIDRKLNTLFNLMCLFYFLTHSIFDEQFYQREIFESFPTYFNPMFICLGKPVLSFIIIFSIFMNWITGR